MRKIIRKRQGGKTTEIIKRANEIGGIIVCFSERQKVFMMKKAEEMGLQIHTPFVANTLSKLENLVTYNGGFNEQLLVDDCDELLARLFGNRLDTITMTVDENEDGGNLNE